MSSAGYCTCILNWQWLLIFSLLITEYILKQNIKVSINCFYKSDSHTTLTCQEGSHCATADIEDVPGHKASHTALSQGTTSPRCYRRAASSTPLGLDTVYKAHNCRMLTLIYSQTFISYICIIYKVIHMCTLRQIL